MVLDDEDPLLFQVFIEWLYTGNLLFHCEDPHVDERNSTKWSAMLNLYVFAEKRIIPMLQNDLVDAMWTFAQEMDYYPDIETIPAWAQTARTSPLHTFLVDLYVYHANLEELFGDDNDMAISFHVDFVMRIARESNGLAFSDGNLSENFNMWNNRCKYHVHELSEPLCEGGNELGSLRANIEMDNTAGMN